MTAGFEFEETTYFTGPNLTQEMVERAEAQLGRRLPGSYIELLRIRNGGRPVRRCIRTDFRTSWGPDYIEIDAILGIGGSWGIDGDGPGSSPGMIEEWGYPDIGIIICETPSAGHDTIMLDYSGDTEEPSVVYIGEDRTPRKVADSFGLFLSLLRSCDEF